MILKTLAAETRYLRRLCRLHAAKAAVTRRNEELQRLRRLINENRRRLKRLAIEAENCQGAYDTAVEALRTVALSRLQ